MVPKYFAKRGDPHIVIFTKDESFARAARCDPRSNTKSHVRYPPSLAKLQLYPRLGSLMQMTRNAFPYSRGKSRVDARFYSTYSGHPRLHHCRSRAIGIILRNRKEEDTEEEEMQRRILVPPELRQTTLLAVAKLSSSDFIWFCVTRPSELERLSMWLHATERFIEIFFLFFTPLVICEELMNVQTRRYSFFFRPNP